MDNSTDIELLNSWKDALLGDLENVQNKIDIELEKKHDKEAKLAKQLQPILARIAKHQRRYDDIKVKINSVDDEIEKLKQKEDINKPESNNDTKVGSKSIFDHIKNILK